MYRDSSGRALTDYPQPSVAVDTAVLTVPDEDTRLFVLLVRRSVEGEGSEWLLPGTFLHEMETLARAVGRSLREKAGLTPDVTPRQLHVFDHPDRDWRGRVLSVAHVAALPWREIEPVLATGGGAVCVRPVDEVRGLPFDHDEIVGRAVADMRRQYLERPDPDGLLDEPFTIRDLHRLHEAVEGGLGFSPDTFRRAMLPRLKETRRRSEGTVGKPAQLYVRR
ncbi:MULTISPECIES: NUDIX domain-containing protein [unclassified Blastococcus]|uniref:NUDIX hydrolase n=1 Tax=unclassified Blastococcus TaxID=2619396 RepID=UPI001EF0426F|nr:MULTISPECIES: NUDIX domain-containing protein [unclassified Blastococcus]